MKLLTIDIRKYFKHFIISFLISLIIFGIPSLFETQPNEIILLFIVIPFFYWMILKYHILVLVLIILVLLKIEIKLSPYVVSFSMVLYTVLILLLSYLLELDIISEIEEGPAWSILLMVY